uniref:Uncharacterized protein n=1 Tax=Pristionchus pacificus TaxID=54126 RepID=A0A8R1UP56_PRIPA
MGAIISIFEKGFAGLCKGFAKGIGKAFKAGLTDPAKQIADGISGMTDGAGKEFEAYRQDLSKWFDMPEKMAPNVNSLTTIVVHLSEPIYFLVIILCALASIVILRYLFKNTETILQNMCFRAAKTVLMHDDTEINVGSTSKVDQLVEKYELKMLETFAIMGAIISAIVKPITDAVNIFVGQIGKLPKDAMNEFENVRKDMKPWFELPRNITANMNTVTSILEYLCVPVYVLIIILCIFLSVLIIRGLFKSVQDCLDTWFYFERNEKHMRLPGSPEDKEWTAPYSCWRRFLTCFYRRRIYVTDLEDAPHVPDMVEVMGNIPLLNVVKAGIAEIITNVEVEIGGSIGKGINGTAKVLGNGISEIVQPAWRYMGQIRGSSGQWFKAPDKIVDQSEKLLKDLGQWFKAPDKIIFLIILCAALCCLALRTAFKSLQDCLDTIFYLKHNKWRMRAARFGVDEPIQYSFWSRVLSRLYKRRIIVEEVQVPLTVPVLIKKFEINNISSTSFHIS